MTKGDFTRIVAGRSGMTQKDVRIIIDTMSDIILRIIAKEDSVKFGSVCTFYGVTKPARTARNPKTGEIVQIEERHGCPKCKFSTSAKEQS